MAGSVSQASTMAVLCLFLFISWSVGASSVDHLYSFPERWDTSFASHHIEVLQLEDLSPRVRRQSGLESPEATSSSVSDASPDTINGVPSGNGSAVTPAAQSNDTSSSNSNSSPGNGSDTSEVDDNSNNQANTDDTSTLSPEDLEKMENADIHHLNHKYYTLTVTNSGFSTYWSELDRARKHTTLSNGHRLAAVVNLQFPFFFYGHRVNSVTIATGGFIYMSHFLHQWLTTTQYIAPLMANFDTSLSNDSHIVYQSTPDKFTVEWRDVSLKDQRSAGKFRFQAVLHKDNTIHFLYKNLPIPISEISKKQHPVRVGLSDAWYNDTFIEEAGLMRRTIIEYDRVGINTTMLQSGYLVVINPLPTCNRLLDCDSCTRHVNVSFNCKWCGVIGRCSDGPDWYRQHWNKRGCGENNHVDPNVCSGLPEPEHPVVDPHQSPRIDKCQNGGCDKDDSNAPVVAVVVSILLIAAILGAIGAWVFYAYTHPTSKSGMWLMEHRPSQIKAKIKFWKSNTASGTKYQVESDA